MSKPNFYQTVYIADCKLNKEIGVFVPNNGSVNEKELEEYRGYFKQNLLKKSDYKSKVSSMDGSKKLFMKISKNNIFYLTSVDKRITDDSVFDLIDEIDNQNIYKYVDKSGTLSNLARQNLQYLLDKFQETNSKISEVQKEINDVSLQMRKNVKNLVNNVEDARELENKSTKIKDTSLLFKNNSSDLKNLAKSRKLKIIVALGFFIVAVLLVFYFSFT